MSGFKPLNRHDQTIAMPLGTVAATAGQVLTRLAAGSLTNSVAVSSAAYARWVVAANADNSAGVAKSTTEVLVWPTYTGVRFEAVCSTTPIATHVGTVVNIKTNATLGNETATAGHFLIEGIINTTAKTVFGCFVGVNPVDLDD